MLAGPELGVWSLRCGDNIFQQAAEVVRGSTSGTFSGRAPEAQHLPCPAFHCTAAWAAYIRNGLQAAWTRGHICIDSGQLVRVGQL